MIFKTKRPADVQLGQLMQEHRIDAVFDIGGNVGQTGKMLRSIGYKGRIVSFEPVQAAHARLEAVASRDPQWLVAPRMALSSHNGTVTLHVTEPDDLSSVLPPSDVLLSAFPKMQAAGKQEAPCTRLDEVFGLYAGDAKHALVKIDTQGSEADIIEGCSGALDRVAGFYLELSLVELYDGEPSYMTVLKRLHDLGYEPHLMTPRTFSKRLTRQLQIDATCFRV